MSSKCPVNSHNEWSKCENKMNLNIYLSTNTIKNNWKYLFESYELEYNIPIETLFKTWCDIKQKVISNIPNLHNLDILDIGGHSLYSPLCVFENKYRSYSLLNCSENDIKIQREFFTECENDFNIEYVKHIEKDKYDLILDWQGQIIFNDKFCMNNIIKLTELVSLTGKYLIFEGPKKLNINLDKNNIKFFKKYDSKIEENMVFDIEQYFKSISKNILACYDKTVNSYMWIIEK